MDKNLENSIVIVADAQGALHLFLEGSYALGLINLGKDSAAVSIHQSRRPAPLIVHTLVGQGSDKTTSLQPSVVKLPLLDESTVYNVANVSSAVFALLKYSIRVLNDMVKAWFGTESLEGGRDVGRKWIKVLEEKEMLLDGDGHNSFPFAQHHAHTPLQQRKPIPYLNSPISCSRARRAPRCETSWVEMGSLVRGLASRRCVVDHSTHLLPTGHGAMGSHRTRRLDHRPRVSRTADSTCLRTLGHSSGGSARMVCLVGQFLFRGFVP